MKIGVIGAGVMGSGIAQTFADIGNYPVVLCDIKIEHAQAAKDKISKSLEKLVAKEKINQTEIARILDNIAVGTKADLSDCDLIIEAAIEQVELKRELFKGLQAICKKDAIFATNTSSISITKLSVGIDRPIIGIHFFNPVPRMKLVEIVTGVNTPTALITQVENLVKTIDKISVVAKDDAGFIVNRILIPMINEAIGVFANKTATKEDIDIAMKLGANQPMGPLELGDLIGLDVCLAIMEVLHSQTKDEKYRPHPLLCKMVTAGHLGRKTGEGFYKY